MIKKVNITKRKGVNMKTLTTLTMLSLIAVFTMTGKSVYADESDDYKLIKSKTLERAELNLILALKSNSTMLQSSAIEVMFELKRTYAEFTLRRGVIPIMKVLRDHPDQSTRIMAALLLYDIQDGRGLYALHEAVRFDKSQTVRHICDSIFRSDKTYFTELAMVSSME
jgi:hypothetical protein